MKLDTQIEDHFQNHKKRFESLENPTFEATKQSFMSFELEDMKRI